MTRPSWDEYFSAFARLAATRADCTRRQVGCVIVQDNRIVATGYNGAPSGQPHCKSDQACPRGRYDHAQVPSGADYKTVPCIAVHAEANAVAYARESLMGATVYVTHRPCPQCDELLAEKKVGRIVVVE